MIAFGDDNRAPRAGAVTLAPGLGLTNRVVIDQHFSQRNRLGRLITALAFNPFLIGLGLDEDTAAFIAPDQTVEVEGSGTLTVVDAEHLKFSSMDRASANDAVSMLGLTLHVLVRGATFNLHTREAAAGSLAVGKG
jgi:cyanophycinase